MVQTYRPACTIQIYFPTAPYVLCCTRKGIRDVWSVDFRRIAVNYNVQFTFRTTECADIKLPSLHTFIMFGAWIRGCTVAQLVEALRYKPVGCGFDSLWCPSGRTMDLGLTQPLTKMSTRNISWGSKGSRCVGLTTLPPSCANCLEIWEPQPPGTLRACPGL